MEKIINFTKLPIGSALTFNYKAISEKQKPIYRYIMYTEQLFD